MAGMMSQALEPKEKQSPGPVAQTPPTGAPTSGATTAGSSPGPGQPQAQPVNREGGDTPEEFERLRDEAIKLVYGERFDQLVKMFETNGVENFPRSVAVAINTALTELEKSNPMPYETAARIGMDLMFKLIEDMTQVVPEVGVEQIQEALPATLVMYADSHDDVSKEDVQGVVAEAQKGVAEAQGAAA